MYLYFETEHPQPYGWTSFHANWAFQVLVLVHEYYLMFSLQENYHCIRENVYNYHSDCIREKNTRKRILLAKVIARECFSGRFRGEL